MIATSKKVELKGIDEKVVEKASQPEYFGTSKERTERKKGEEAFFKQGEKPEVSANTSVSMVSSMKKETAC